MATKDKPALELIRTPEHMAELQDEETAVKEGYHLGKINYNNWLLLVQRKCVSGSIIVHINAKQHNNNI